MAREECVNNKKISKSIKKVLPSDENMVIIVDDRVDVWDNIENLVNITPFFFFKEELNKLNYVQEKFLKDDLDCSLYSIPKLLNFIHKSFYSYYLQYNDICDVRLIKKEKIKSIFNNVYASFLEESYVNLLETIEFSIISMFGGIFDNEISSKTNIIIANFSDNGNNNIKLREEYRSEEKISCGK